MARRRSRQLAAVWEACAPPPLRLDAEARRRYGTQVGVLAQECEQAGIPEIVSTDPETGRKSVAYDAKKKRFLSFGHG